MNQVLPLTVAAALIIAFGTLTVVVQPHVQLSKVEADPGSAPYTIEQARGRRQYVSLGCVNCHSQQPRDRAFGPDEQRGWGRAPTPGDYAWDYPQQLGTARTGPDLFNIGARQSDEAWHLAHLYQPRSVVPESIMPAMPFLFEEKTKAGPGDVVVSLAAEYQPRGKVVVAKQEALDLVAYLQVLDHSYPSAYIETAEADTEEGDEEETL